MEKLDFQYYKTSTLINHVGKEVEWLDVTGKVRKGFLEGNSKRTWLPEACCPFADTVKIKLMIGGQTCKVKSKPATIAEGQPELFET